MDSFRSPVEILKLLDKSNCGKCGWPTCLAFASEVFKGTKSLADCPALDSDVIAQYGEVTSSRIPVEELGGEAIEALKRRISDVDLAEAAGRLGGVFSNGKLTIKCLGKDFSVDSRGDITTEIHVNPWVTVPVLTYILEGAGTPVTGEWMTYRELDGGENRYPLFEQRCEKPLKRVADTYTDLFRDMLEIFNGRQVDYHYLADISIILRPLPLVPLMVCYTLPEDGLESSLSVFFDATVTDNLGLDAAFTLGAGLTTMFEKIARRHSR